MGKDLIKLPNNKRGFLTLIIIEAIAAAWAISAVLYAIRVGRTRTVVYGFITLFAVFYILGRSLRAFAGILKKEREEKAQGGEKHE